MENKNVVLNFVKAQALSIVLTLACILIFALAIKYFELKDSCIVPVNYAIKALCIASGVFVLTKSKHNGLKNGVLHGLLYVVISFLVFSFLNHSFVLEISLLIEMLLGALVGGIFGVVFVNMKHK